MGAEKNSSRRRWGLQQDEHEFQHTSLSHYPGWPSPCSHWSATGPRNQQTTLRANTHQHAQRKLARLAACAAPVRPVDRAGQAGDYSSRTTSVLRASVTSLCPGTKTPPKHNLHRRKNPTQSLAKQLQKDQELTSNTTTQRQTSQAFHPTQIPQVAYTGQTGHAHRLDRSSLGISG
jgi:hypothetical protein